MASDTLFRDLSNPEPDPDGVYTPGGTHVPPPGFRAAVGSESLPAGDKVTVHPRGSEKAQRFTAAQWKLVLEHADDLVELAARLGRKLATVERAARQYGWFDKHPSPKRPLRQLGKPGADYIRQQLKWGVKVTELAAEFGVTKGAIYDFMKKHDIPQPNPQTGDFHPDAKRVHEAYATASSMREVALATGLSFGKVQHIIYAFNPDGSRKPRRR